MTPAQEQELAALSEQQRQREADDGRLEELLQQARTRDAYAEQAQQAKWKMLGLEGQLADCERWRAFLVASRQTIGDELLALPRGRTRPEQDLRSNLEISIISIDRGLLRIEGARAYTLRSTRLGELMLAAGLVSDSEEHSTVHGGLDWRGSLPEVEKQLQQLTKQRDAAAAELGAASLSEEQRAQLQAERAARPTRKRRDDGTYYDVFYVDGRRIDVEVAPS